MVDTTDPGSNGRSWTSGSSADLQSLVIFSSGSSRKVRICPNTAMIWQLAEMLTWLKLYKNSCQGFFFFYIYLWSNSCGLEWGSRWLGSRWLGDLVLLISRQFIISAEDKKTAPVQKVLPSNTASSLTTYGLFVKFQLALVPIVTHPLRCQTLVWKRVGGRERGGGVGEQGGLYDSEWFASN